MAKIVKVALQKLEQKIPFYPTFFRSRSVGLSNNISKRTPDSEEGSEIL